MQFVDLFLAPGRISTTPWHNECCSAFIGTACRRTCFWQHSTTDSVPLPRISLVSRTRPQVFRGGARRGRGSGSGAAVLRTLILQTHNAAISDQSHVPHGGDGDSRRHLRAQLLLERGREHPGPGPGAIMGHPGPGARGPEPGAGGPGHPGPGAGRPGRGPGASRGSGAPQTSTESTKRTESNKSTKRTHTKQEKTKSTKSTKSTPKIAVRPWLALVLDFWKASCAPRRDVTTDQSTRNHRLLGDVWGPGRGKPQTTHQMAG